MNPEEHLSRRLQTSNYSHAVFRIASAGPRYEDLLFCRIDFEKGNAVTNVTYDYGEFRLLRLTLNAKEALDTLQEIQKIGSGPLRMADSTYSIHSRSPMNHHFIPSGRTYGLVEPEWPIDYFSITLGGGLSISWQEMPCRVGLPPYPNMTQAIIEFMDLSRGTVQLSKEIIITAPNYRARIKALSIEGNKMTAEVDTDDPSNLAVKFYCMNGAEKPAYSDDINVLEGKAIFSTSFEPDSVTATLIDAKSNDRVDIKGFGRWHSEQKGVHYQTPTEKISELILSGENENIEFKMDVNNDSKYDLLETVVSFANTKGGVIIVGVDDKHNPRGVIGDKVDMEKKVDGLIRYHCDPKVIHSIEWRDFNDLALMLIHVPEGKTKPYLLRDRGIYVREKSEDRLIDRRQLDEIYKNQQRGGSIFT